jgi:hypothetical protein
MAQYEELTIDQGTDQTIEIKLADKDGLKKNLAGYSVYAQMRRTINTSDSDATTFTSIVADPASDGILSLSLTNEQTDALTSGRYFYDVEISHVSGDATIVERVMEGIIQVTPSITRI